MTVLLESYLFHLVICSGFVLILSSFFYLRYMDNHIYITLTQTSTCVIFIYHDAKKLLT